MGAIELQPLELELSVPTGLHRRIAYERLFVDAFNGNPALFVRDDEVKAAWSWIDSVSDAWKDAQLPLQPYPAGSWGPDAAAPFLPPPPTHRDTPHDRSFQAGAGCRYRRNQCALRAGRRRRLGTAAG